MAAESPQHTHHTFVGLTEYQTEAMQIALEEIGYYMVADGLRDMDQGGKEDIRGLLRCLVRTDKQWRELNRPAFHTHIMGAIVDGLTVATNVWEEGTDPWQM